MNTSRLIEILRSVYANDSTLSLHEPWFCGREIDYLTECIKTNYVSSIGPFCTKFETQLSEYTRSAHVVGAVNGTSALHLALTVLGVAPGEEVIVPSLGFVATANAVSYCGASPHFVDVDAYTFCLDPVYLEAYLSSNFVLRDGVCSNLKTGKRVRAIIVIHSFGFSADLDPLLDICKKYSLALIEDAAESLGTFYRGKHTGTCGTIGVLSFNGNKIVTTGGGGALLIQDADLAARARHLSTTAKQPHPWRFFHDEVGFNYRIPNINAALGCAQLENLSMFLARKRKLADRMRAAFAGFSGAEFVSEPAYCESNYWLMTLKLSEISTERRESVLTALHEAGISARPVWALLPSLPMYKEAPRSELKVSEILEQSLINIPSSAFLG